MSLIHDCFYQFVLQRIIKEIWVRDRQISLKLCKHYEKWGNHENLLLLHTKCTNTLVTLKQLTTKERKILLLFVKTLLPTRMIFNSTHYHLPPIVRENWPILYSKFLTKAMLYHTPWGPSITDVCSVNLWEKSNLVGGHLRSMWDYFLDALVGKRNITLAKRNSLVAVEKLKTTLKFASRIRQRLQETFY